MTNCPDCGVAAGQKHKAGCDVERCPCCGHQAIGCDCMEGEGEYHAIPWNGEWPGKAECREYGLYAKMVKGKGWQPCAPTDEGAIEDLNTLVIRGRWDANTQKWVLPS